MGLHLHQSGSVLLSLAYVIIVNYNNGYAQLLRIARFSFWLPFDVPDLLLHSILWGLKGRKKIALMLPSVDSRLSPMVGMLHFAVDRLDSEQVKGWSAFKSEF